MTQDKYLLSAIVSAYNAEEFIAGCLDDLEEQTISEQLEIIVVDTGSTQGEGDIVRAYQHSYDNIVYIRTEQRETIYQAWNRGVKAAKGRFLTNANTDDRHRTDAFEIMVGVLEDNPQFALAYADAYITPVPNQAFDNCTRAGVYKWPDFSRRNLLHRCIVGPQPVWRRCLHDEVGYFDDKYHSAADYDFWLRLAQGHDFFHIPEYLGLIWFSNESLSVKGDDPRHETDTIKERYAKIYLAAPRIQSAEKGVIDFVQQLYLDSREVNIYTGDGLPDTLASDISQFPSVRLHTRDSGDTPLFNLALLEAGKIDVSALEELLTQAPVDNIAVYAGRLTGAQQLLLSSYGFEALETEGVFRHAFRSRFADHMIAEGKSDIAISYYRKLIAANRAGIDIYTNLGRLYLSAGQAEPATRYFQQALALDRKHPGALSGLARSYQDEGKADKAGEILALLKGSPATGPVHPDTDQQQSGTATRNSQCRILLLNDLFPPQDTSGYAILMRDFSELLLEKGHEVLVMTAFAGAVNQADEANREISRLQLRGEYRDEGFKLYGPERLDEISRFNADCIEQAIRDFRPDICMAGNIELLGEEVFRPFFDNNIPVVHYLGLTNPGYGKDLIPNHSSYHVVLASHWLADYFSSENYRFTRSSVIYPGARVDEFYLPIQPAFDTPRIIIAGMVAPHKGVSVLIQALAMLHHYGSKFSCTIAGAMPDQRYIEKLQQFIDQHGMADKIRFTGELSRQQLLNEFATHNILVFPSVVAETFGISQVEAMAAGLLVVSTATGGASEIIQDEKTGLVIKHNDVAALTLCLRTALDDPQHCCEIARAGQLVARDRFDIRQSVTDLEQLYIRLLPA